MATQLSQKVKTVLAGQASEIPDPWQAGSREQCQGHVLIGQDARQQARLPGILLWFLANAWSTHYKPNPEPGAEGSSLRLHRKSGLMGVPRSVTFRQVTHSTVQEESGLGSKPSTVPTSSTAFRPLVYH